MSITRRQFLKGLAIASASTLFAPVSEILADSTAPISVQDYLTAMETPFTAPLNDIFEGVIRNENMGVLLYDVYNKRLLTALNPEKPLPVASAFKAPLLMYFVDVVDRDVWAHVPVQYWEANSSNDVPEEAREYFKQHRDILRSLYQTLVYSDNVQTGVVLAYVARAQGSKEALTSFNDWAQERVGISQLSGLSAWVTSPISGYGFVDTRFKGRETSINSQLTEFDNMMTPRDLGLFYMWMLAELDSEQQAVCKALLSTIFNNRGANLERTAQANDGIPYSKNGSLDTDSGYVVSDAGLMELADGRLYLLVLQSLDVNDGRQSIVPNVFGEVHYTLQGRYNEVLHNRHVSAVSKEELLATYLAHTRQAYPQQTDSYGGRYRYGFILPEGVDVYTQPDENAKVHNPIIKSTRFGIHLLMQGALVRYTQSDANWVELQPDDDFDNVRVRLGRRVFVKREDVWDISREYAQPIRYISDPTATADDKYVVVNVVDRELTAFEGSTALFRIPIVLNPDATPRGAQVITSKWFSRSMQPWAPGVPFTSFFGAEGFALHGSPWQRWHTTVNQSTIMGRTSAGCVNVPNWMITSGTYHRPADELLFRWVGGMENVTERVFDYPSQSFPALRIYSVDYLPNLRNYYRPIGMVNRNLTWDDIIATIEDTPLQAPDSFFV